MSRKSKIVVTIAVLLAAGVVGLYFLGLSGSWKKYANKRYSFSVDYPSTWKVGPAPENNDGREFFSPDESISCRAYGFQNALFGVGGEPQTLDEFIDWLTDDPSVAIVSKSDQQLTSSPGMQVVTKTNGIIQSAVYTLGPEVGYGFVCYYESNEELEKHARHFQHMVDSFSLTSSSKESLGNTNISCQNYLNGVIVPFQDQQVFLDEIYTEVTLTSRDAWDRSKLPKKVIDLESIDYTCYPMPFEMNSSDQTDGIYTEPEVTSVEWICELEHTDYQFVGSTNVNKKASLESSGYTCEKQACFEENNTNSDVWLCTRLAQ